MDFQRFSPKKEFYTEEEFFNMLVRGEAFSISLEGEYEAELANVELLAIKKSATDSATGSVIKMNKNRIDETLQKLIRIYEKIVNEEINLYISVLSKALGDVNMRYILEKNIPYSINWVVKTLTIN